MSGLLNPVLAVAFLAGLPPRAVDMAPIDRRVLPSATIGSVGAARDTTLDAYLRRFRARYPLDSVVAGAPSDLERVRRLSRWVRTRFDHNGSNAATVSDPIAILDSAATGQRFRCVEYAIVLAGALRAVGVPARTLGLQRADVETAKCCAGHVVAEAWLRDARRWVLVDGQWDALAFRGDVPLDAVALRSAILDGAPDLRVESLSGTGTRGWTRWMQPYLHFMVHRPMRSDGVRDTLDVMFVPEGSTPPKLFQRQWPQSPYRVATSVDDFMAPPTGAP
ncbi:MAG: transglutaminase-like domain-containing protein [Gemmatimonadaceae bacterium]|nr:transglutaminase-like domain-containing protein [Gemmatimonadaceae bacterium]